MPVCPIGAMYSGVVHVEHAEKAGAELRTDATAYRLEKGEGGKIAAVHYRSSKGDDVRLTARYFVVACHGLETPKLLLISEVANSSDQVGRNLMDHSGIGLQFLADEPLWQGRGQIQQGGIFNWRDGPFRASHAAIKHAPSNYVPNTGRRPAAARGRRARLRARPPHPRRGVALGRHLDGVRDAAEPRPTGSQPNPNRQDALGIPMLKVHYDIDDYVKAARPVAMNDFRNFVSGMGGEVVVDDTGWQNRDHLMGSVIMGADPANSVVDGDCRTYRPRQSLPRHHRRHSRLRRDQPDADRRRPVDPDGRHHRAGDLR